MIRVTPPASGGRKVPPRAKEKDTLLGRAKEEIRGREKAVGKARG